MRRTAVLPHEPRCELDRIVGPHRDHPIGRDVAQRGALRITALGHGADDDVAVGDDADDVAMGHLDDGTHIGVTHHSGGRLQRGLRLERDDAGSHDVADRLRTEIRGDLGHLELIADVGDADGVPAVVAGRSLGEARVDDAREDHDAALHVDAELTVLGEEVVTQAVDHRGLDRAVHRRGLQLHGWRPSAVPVVVVATLGIDECHGTHLLGCLTTRYPLGEAVTPSLRASALRASVSPLGPRTG